MKGLGYRWSGIFQIYFIKDSVRAYLCSFTLHMQERHRALISQYYRGAAAALLVYDITNKKSFQNISRYDGLSSHYVYIFKLASLKKKGGWRI